MKDGNNKGKSRPAGLAEAIEKLKEIVNKELKAEGAMSDAGLEALMDIMDAMETLFSVYANTFTSKDRTRLISVGIKNFGFISTAYNSAAANEQFVPSYLNMKDFDELAQDFSHKRTLLTRVQQFEQQVSDSMLRTSDADYRNALGYYASVKEAARQRVPGAEAEFKLLANYFKKSKSPKDAANPTQAQIERDVAGLLHGTKEGRIVIENENARLSGGKRRLIDETHSEHAAGKTIIKDGENK
ncbi:MAG: hypothetical protein LBU37_12515 [Tannerellaceae bacterium]|jgi:hypothetical protein|nr:hypothetical protein [Tannerellaceae bacterium]